MRFKSICQISTFLAATLPGALFSSIDGYVDAGLANTIAYTGTPTPFYSSSSNTGNLWKLRSGFGFDVNQNAEIFEKDSSTGGNNFGDAALLETTISGLNPGQEYGIYVCFLSASGAYWQVLAGLDPSSLERFNRSFPPDRITDLGLTSVSNSNRNQYLGYLGNAVANASGEIAVYVDDGTTNSSNERTWYEGVAYGAPLSDAEDSLSKRFVELAPNGVWTWFNDERAIFHNGFLYTGYVMSDGHYGISRYDPSTNTSTDTLISTATSREQDDHNNPSFTVLPNGRLLVIYSKHGTESRFYYRISNNTTPSTIADWGPEMSKDVSAQYTYNNTYRLSAESVDQTHDRIYNFHREVNWDPTLMYSDDSGATWSASYHLIDAGGRSQRPYPRYWSNDIDRIDFIYSDGHPDSTPCSIYHLYYESGLSTGTGSFKLSDGSTLKTLSDIIGGDPIDHDGDQAGTTGVERGTEVYTFSATSWNASTPEGPDNWIPEGRAWTLDICSDAQGNPVAAFQVQSKDLLNDHTGDDAYRDDRIYYYYAVWTGSNWQRRCIAQAGRPLYGANVPGSSVSSPQRNYSGGMAIDPDNPNVVYISSNALDPFDLNYDSNGFTNNALNANERYEIYRGVTKDQGLSFEWEQITVDSIADNLRPIVPSGHGFDRSVLWFQGDYLSYTLYDCRVVALLENDLQVDSFTLDTGSIQLNWRSSAGRDYKIMGSLDLSSFPFEIDAFSSTGGLANMSADLPPELENASAAFFRVEEVFD